MEKLDKLASDVINGKEITDLVIPNNVSSIGEFAFVGCCHIKSATMFGVKHIGAYAFYYCDSLEAINSAHYKIAMLTGVEVIGKEAFSDCVKLKAFYIPETVKQIGTYAFMGCMDAKIYCVSKKDVHLWR